MEIVRWKLCHVKFDSLNILIDKEEIHVGRTKGLDIPSKHVNVSRKHATVVLFANHTLYVKDHNTVNGTYVNQKRIESDILVQLYENDEIGFGLHSSFSLDSINNNSDPSRAHLVFIVKRTPTQIQLENVNNDSDATTQMDVQIPEIKEDNVNTLIVISDDETSSLPSNNDYNSVNGQEFNNKQVLKSDSEKLDKQIDSVNSNAVEDDGNIPLSNEDLLKILAASQFEEESSNVEKEDEKTIEAIKEENQCNYTLIDDFIVVSDDDENVHYSQLLDDNVVGLENNNDDGGLNDSLFISIKKEVEELDRLPYGTIFSRMCVDDDESSWLFEDNCEDKDCNDLNKLVSEPEKDKDNKTPSVILNPLSIDDKTTNDHQLEIGKENFVMETNGNEDLVFEDDKEIKLRSGSDENTKQDKNHKVPIVLLNPLCIDAITATKKSKTEKQKHVALKSHEPSSTNTLPDADTAFNQASFESDESSYFEAKKDKHDLKIKHKNQKVPIVLLHSLSSTKSANSDRNRLDGENKYIEAMDTNIDESSFTNLKAELENKKKRQIEKEHFQAKKIKTTSFFGKQTQAKSMSIVAHQYIKDRRKQKLKEIASKLSLPQNSIKENLKQPVPVKNVKVSDSRGKFLIETEPIPSTSKERLLKSTSLKSAKVEPKKTILISPQFKIPKKKSVKTESSLVKPSTTKTSYQASLQKKDIKCHTEVPTSSRHNEVTKHAPTHTMKTYQELENIVIEIIHWNPVWFTEYMNHVEWGLPKLVIKNLRVMVDSFTSYAEYYDVVIPQMLMELWYFFFKEIDSLSDPRKNKFHGILQDEIRIPHKYTQLSYTTYINKKENDEHLHVKEDDILILQYRRQEENVTKAKVVLGYVTKVTKRFKRQHDYIDQHFAKFVNRDPYAFINFQILVKSSNGTAIRGTYSQIRIITSVVSTMRIFKSVDSLKDSLLQKHILKPTKELYQISPVGKSIIYSTDVLNNSQSKAVLEASAMCFRNSPGIYLIQGPPGTGKTTVIINIIQQILFHPNNSSNRCILVVAPSNGAVDELALRIIGLKSKFNVLDRKLKLVRMGPKNMVHPKVQNYLLIEIAKRNVGNELLTTVSETQKELLMPKHKVLADLRVLVSKDPSNNVLKMKLNTAKLDYEKACRRIIGGSYNEQLKKCELKLLNGAEIICTTLSSCVGLRMEEVFGRSQNNKITCCIVDEATQSNEQETLIPLILGVKNVVLVGDPKQLPAVTKTKEAKDFGYGKSLFSRIMSNFPLDETNPVQLLTTQYRMHPEISQFPNSAFYNGQLIDAPSVKIRKGIFSALHPYLVFNFDMEAIMNSQEYSNKAEIVCVLKLLHVLSRKFNNSFNFTIGVITPYNNQKVRISEELIGKSFGANVSVNTVDSFQGQEKDVIILSCVRESTNNFVNDEQRLNVALTRARHGLFIIASSSLFQSSEIFGIIRDDALKRKLFIKVNSRTSEMQLFNYISKENRK